MRRRNNRRLFRRKSVPKTVNRRILIEIDLIDMVEIGIIRERINLVLLIIILFKDNDHW